jgi:hypothetical protein
MSTEHMALRQPEHEPSGSEGRKRAADPYADIRSYAISADIYYPVAHDDADAIGYANCCSNGHSDTCAYLDS